MVKDKHVDKAANVAREVVLLSAITVAASAANVLFDTFMPGYDFEVLAVEGFAEDVTGTVTFDIDIGSTSVLNADAVPTADTRVAGVLSTTLADRQGTSAEILNLRATTGGGEAITNLKVKVTIRPRGLKGDPNAILGS
jgi:hypothetical protein